MDRATEKATDHSFCTSFIQQGAESQYQFGFYDAWVPRSFSTQDNTLPALFST